MADRENWNVMIAGECMVCRPFGVHDDPRSMAVIELLRDSDVTYAHLEMNIAEFDEVEWPAKAEWTGSFMIAKPDVLNDLKWAGVDIMSLAHNHSFDFGASVVLSTRRHCEQAGIAVAGIGRDLEEAREPTYVETRNGRVAMISASSGNKAFEWAGLPKASWKGRPGVNPQRLHMKYVIDQEAAEQLKAIATRLDVLRTPKNSHINVRGFTGENEFGIAQPGQQSMPVGDAWVAGDRFEIRSLCHPKDLAGNMRSVEEARTMADLVIMAHHFNVSEGTRGDTPPEFVREFAHAAIDAGADIYVGHGWHRTLGIEIYKGKPIFYGLGNFFAQSEFIQRVPYDSYEAWGHDVEKLQTLTPATFPLHPGFDRHSDTWWTSALIGVDIEDNRLKRIRLYPVDMGRDATSEGTVHRATGRGGHALTEGRPMLANVENAARVLERYRRLSADFGTTVRIEDGVGIVEL